MDGGLSITGDQVTVGDRSLPLLVRRSTRARRITLRLDSGNYRLVLTLPRGVSERAGLRFLSEKSVWVGNVLARLPEPVPFADGAAVPYLGVRHTIRHSPRERGGVWRHQDKIHVSGEAAHLPRRLTDWLRSEARRECSARAREKAAAVDRAVQRVSVRDVSSRWGSASTRGNLNFAWRLIFAPEFVLDYVVAHEVAHLVEMNHGKGFWRIVDDLTPDADGARSWLRVNGAALHCYGRSG